MFDNDASIHILKNYSNQLGFNIYGKEWGQQKFSCIND